MRAHEAAERLPLALAEVHRALPVGARFRVDLRHDPELVSLLLEGAGFEVEAMSVRDGTTVVACTRGRTLPDLVAPGLRLLVCGLNASVYAADVGIAYGRPGNRFWPAALAAGLVTVARDQWHALCHHGVGFTDLVKRATVAASEVTAAEFRHGFTRLERVCELVRPGAVAVLGVTGWRHATGDRTATFGWQARRLGPSPVYVLPNPSGLNAHTTVADVAEHLRAAAS